MRSARVLALLLLTVVALSGCARIFAGLNGAEVLREETWTRSDGAACTTRWTLVVINSLDTEEGPIENVREAFGTAEPTADEVDAARDLLATEFRDEFGDPDADDRLRFETYALATALQFSALDQLADEGISGGLDVYELGYTVECD
ncbi:hypothetical protein HD599_001361 [Conyzicola lurida]|uniref:Lipoprotein n=1 Tax=Conyzicola lurida TaxID=1172621 RepID=A0A841AL13_9MICO|nr:hypothetical protein [Conyzicola lurida]MBB5843038.1 hypothetical protein [Conyzicola lurida]